MGKKAAPECDSNQLVVELLPTRGFPRIPSDVGVL